MTGTLGIDPGKEGAYFLLDGDRIEYDVLPYADKLLDVAAFSRELQALGLPDIAYLERQSPRPGEGGVGAFRMGQNYGAIRATLLALQVPIVEVTPQAWRKALGLPSIPKPKGASPAQLRNHKKRVKATTRTHMTQRFPQIDFLKNHRCRVPHEGIVDAGAIACAGAAMRMRGVA